MAKEVKVFQTEDGKVFNSQEVAENYEYVSKKLMPAWDFNWNYNHDELEFVRRVYDWTISVYIADLKVIARNYDYEPYFNLVKLESIKKNNLDWEYSRGVEYIYSTGINNVAELVQAAMKMVEYLE